jgi:hypothetical protein
MDFWWWLITWRLIERPKIETAIAEHATRAEIRIFSGPEELERYLSSIAAVSPPRSRPEIRLVIRRWMNARVWRCWREPRATAVTGPWTRKRV